eukprot:TRINITY_DN5425_c0_g1_i8.p1 TRINITY_DN5425_c0_g1~~TRINITY_DN5425_c0_g1_i8.p1  ORF type:complete len:199 (+),score=-6.38 TRINITY_DN5425_c0_g1_i8:652-1248(+)
MKFNPNKYVCTIKYKNPCTYVVTARDCSRTRVNFNEIMIHFKKKGKNGNQHSSTEASNNVVIIRHYRNIITVTLQPHHVKNKILHIKKSNPHEKQRGQSSGKIACPLQHSKCKLSAIKIIVLRILCATAKNTENTQNIMSHISFLQDHYTQQYYPIQYEFQRFHYTLNNKVENKQRSLQILAIYSNVLNSIDCYFNQC